MTSLAGFTALFVLTGCVLAGSTTYTLTDKQSGESLVGVTGSVERVTTGTLLSNDSVFAWSLATGHHSGGARFGHRSVVTGTGAVALILVRDHLFQPPGHQIPGDLKCLQPLAFATGESTRPRQVVGIWAFGGPGGHFTCRCHARYLLEMRSVDRAILWFYCGCVGRFTLVKRMAYGLVVPGSYDCVSQSIAYVLLSLQLSAGRNNMDTVI